MYYISGSRGPRETPIIFIKRGEREKNNEPEELTKKEKKHSDIFCSIITHLLNKSGRADGIPETLLPKRKMFTSGKKKLLLLPYIITNSLVIQDIRTKLN